MTAYNPQWDLETIFAGGSTSTALQAAWQEVNDAYQAILDQWDQFPAELTPATEDRWVELIHQLETLTRQQREISAFVGCLLAQNVRDEKAYQLLDQVTQISTKSKIIGTQLAALYREQDQANWEHFLAHPEIQPIAFALEERREIGRSKMATDKEILVEELAADGYMAWGKLYNRIAGDLEADFEENGTTRRLSMSQLASKLSHPQREVRQRAFETFEAKWQSVAPLTAMTLNFLGGFRHTMYKHRHWDSILQEPLQQSRLKPETLHQMWSVIQQESPRLGAYFKAKAKLLGIDQLTWYDVNAPVGAPDQRYTYDEACKFIIQQHQKFDPQLAEFSQMAMEKRWIEAEDRAGKQAGGFCTGFPKSEQWRIFMTFTGTYDNLATLAHELGHAYHGWVMRDLPLYIRHYPMTLAETASTFSEAIVADGAYSTATTDAEKLFLLDIKLSDAVAFMMNIQARYLFELSFYEARKTGAQPVDALNQLMLDAQKKAFNGFFAEDGYHPLFWASKLHFYITEAPFYNFPYTFGYLFSNGIYQRSLDGDPNFAQKYVDLLRDTGRMTCEDVAQRHLGVDLTQPDFWKDACDHVLSGVDEFVTLAEKLA